MSQSFDAASIHTALEAADGYLTLKMWEAAWNCIEDLPTELKNHPDALAVRLDVMVGMQEWEKGMYLGRGAVTMYPRRADLWLKLARLQAQHGEVEQARQAVQRCIEIDGEMRTTVLDDPLLEAVW